MPDGVDRVAGLQPLSGAPWLMLAGIPEAEVNGAIRASLLRIAQELALAGLAAALLAWIVLRRVVVPIRILSEGAQSFAAGFLNRRIPLRRRDELGDLAGALNSMATALEQRLEEEEAHARALQELNRLQAEFVATASHELRTPVTAIRTYAEALLRPQILDDESRRECLEGIDRASDRLARLARTLLDVSRIDRGQVPVQLGPVDVAAVARAAVAQATAAGGSARSRIDLPPELPPVRADADRLEDVLANLIGNAYKFAPPDSSVTIRACQTGATIAIAVIDGGPGIPPAERERIFDRFYQVQRGADRHAGGSGLGLYIARGYVTAMGGHIRAEGAPGGGSAFVITLTANDAVDAPVEADGVRRVHASGPGAPARRR
jgi:signal transduction histidine kinase